VFPPEDQKFWLCLFHPRLPFRVCLYIRVVVIEEIALDLGLSGRIQKRIFVSP
jgi:hypothetical protein